MAQPARWITRWPIDAGRTARAIFCVALVALVVVGTWQLSHGVRSDFLAIFQGAQAVYAGRSPYDTPLGGYIYPPLLAVLQSPLVPLGLVGASLVWGALNALALYWACRASAQILTDRLAVPRDIEWELSLGSVVILASPVQQLLTGGQTDAVMLLGFVVALALVDPWPIASGFALGFSANIKYTALAMVPYLVLRRRFSAAGATVAGAILFALVPALAVGWTRNLAYLRRAVGALLTLFGMSWPSSGQDPLRGLHPITFNESVSLTSMAARLSATVGDGPHVTIGLAGAMALTVLGLIVGIYRVSGVPLWAGRGGHAEREPLPRAVLPLEWMSVLVIVALFSPQYLSRHMVVLMPLMMILWMTVCVPRPAGARWPQVAGAVLLLLGTSLPNWEGSPPGTPRRVWRAWGGPSWCLVACYLVVLWSGLRYARAVVQERLVSPKFPSRTSVWH